jgi:hypothetical protein
MKLSTIIGLASTTLALGFWMMPVIGNNDLFPETRICFRPKTVKNPKNDYLMRCDSNERTGVILTSVFKQLDKKNIEFHNKIATDSITQHFDNNLAQTELSQAIAILLGCVGVGGFSMTEAVVRDEKNKRYHEKRKEILINEASVTQALYPSDPVTVIQNAQIVKEQHIRDITRVQKESILDDLEIAKAKKEIMKLQTSTFTEDKPVSTNKELSNSLIEALKTHEDGWMWKIIDNQTPLWLIGRQGCGKTFKAATFAMVRKYCLDIPVRHLIDEHATGDNTAIWKYLEPQQISESLEDIGGTFDSIVDGWKLRISGKNEQKQPATITPEQIVVDEYTELKSEVGEPAERFYKRHLKDTRKAKSYVIGVTHNDTNSSYPEGTQAQRESGTILIQAFSANGKVPLPRVKVVRGLLDEAGNELLEFEATIPDWFLPETIHKHFHGSPIQF